VCNGATEALWRDLRPVLDEELHGLPSKYRTPVLLCYLEGKSVQEAARILAVPRGTVLTRLAWARQRLRDRLTRRGLTLSSGLLAVLLFRGASAERVLAATEFDASSCAKALRVGARTTGKRSVAATRLAQEVLKSMRARSLHAAGAALLATMLALWAGLLFADRLLSPSSVPHYSSTQEIYHLQGTWNVVSVERYGGHPGPNDPPFTKLFIRGDLVLGCDRNGSEVVLFQLDPPNHSKSADFRRSALEGLGWQVVYRLEGDTMKVAGRQTPRFSIRGTTSRDPRDYPILIITAKRERAIPASS
jgi:hypothetical protein